MADDDDIFATMGGSLLNDLLSDLDNNTSSTTDDLFTSLEQELATSYGNFNNTNTTTTKPPPGLGSAAAFVVNQQSHLQSTVTTAPTTTTTTSAAAAITNPEDAWSAALAQFGGMSFAADFLAADTAKKNMQSNNNTTSTSSNIIIGSAGGQQQQHPDLVQTESGMLGEAISSNVVDALFEDDEEEEEYKLEQDNIAVDDDGIDETGGLMALLGAASSRSKQQQQQAKVDGANEAEKKKKKSGDIPNNKEEVLLTSPQQQPPTHPPITPDKSGTMAPPPSPMFPPPFPPGVMPPPSMMRPIIPPHPGMMMLPHPHHPGMMMPPPHPGMMMMPPPHHHHHHAIPPPHPGMMMPPLSSQPPGMMMHRPPPPSSAAVTTTTTKANRKFDKDFPALGDEPEEKSQDSDEEEQDTTTAAASSSSSAAVPPMILRRSPNIRIIFNNADPSAPSIPAKSVSTPLMPQRDVCYVIHSMLRPLQSLDTYNDDYYHWSFVDRKSRNLLLLGGVGVGVGGDLDRSSSSSLAQPNPVWKEVKVMAKERETKFRSAVENRAKEFAEEKQSLGRMVKTNVNRPKALLNVPVMTTGEDESGVGEGGSGGVGGDNTNDDKDYVLEQRRNRVQLWKARVSIDKGYSALLSLTELRRLIQANANQPQLVNELMGDVKSNVDLMHASLGVNVRVNSDGSRKMIIDEGRLSSTLSLPKGRVLCARVIEGGILPHQSACEILPVAWRVLAGKPSASASASSDDGEDRLLRALTGLVLSVQPSVDPSILCRCLDAAIAIGDDLSKITQSRVRMELLHSILTRGKVLCGENSDLDGVWKEKEKAFMQILASQQK